MANGKHWRDQSTQCAGRKADDDGAGSDKRCQEALDRDRFVHERADAVVRRLFTVGSDLHAALTRIDEPTAAQSSAAKIDDAIAEVNAAIKDIRHMIFHFENGTREG